jgi:hypothetical protein
MSTAFCNTKQAEGFESGVEEWQYADGESGCFSHDKKQK